MGKIVNTDDPEKGLRNLMEHHTTKCCLSTTEKEKILRQQRERMGICTNCGGMKSNPHWKQCEKCREKERNRRREKLIASYTIELHPNKPSKLKEIDSKHKCWNCEWSTFLGDRFFCPFVEGTCAKDGTTFKVEKQAENGGKT